MYKRGTVEKKVKLFFLCFLFSVRVLECTLLEIKEAETPAHFGQIKRVS